MSRPHDPTWQPDAGGAATEAPDRLGTEAPPPGPIRAEPSARYELGEELGRGGVGVVRRAWDPILRRELALKFLTEASPAAVERFAAEAQVTAQLAHPNIVPVHEVGRGASGAPFIAMKLVRGRSLASFLAAGELSREERLEVFRKVCDALAYAHARGVLHRDVKPDNVMVGEFGEVQLMDWGLARPIGATDAAVRADRFDTDALRTREGQIAGTPAYMAPEQARGELEHLDARADIWALGALLFALLTGRPPFLGDAPTVLSEVAAGRAPSPRQVAGEVPRELDAVVRRAMAPSPADRYPSAVALREDIDAWLARRPLPHVGSSTVERLGKWATRHQGAVRVGLGAALLGALVLLGGATRYAQDVGSARDLALAEAERARLAERRTARELARAQVALADAALRDGDPRAADAALDAALSTLAADEADRREPELARSLLWQAHPPPLTTCRPHGEARVLALALSPTTPVTAVSAGADGSFTTWDPHTCAIGTTLATGLPLLSAGVAWVDGAARGLGAVSGQVVRVEIASGRVASVEGPTEVRGAGLAASGDGWVSSPGAVLVLPADGGPARAVPTDIPGGAGRALDPSGRVVVGPSQPNDRVPGGAWDLATGRALWTDPGINAVAWRDGALLAADAYGATLWVDGARRWARPGVPMMAAGLAEGVAWTRDFGGTVHLYDPADGALLERFPGPASASLVATDAHARRVAMADGATVSTWLRPAGDPTRIPLPGPEITHALDVSPDSRLVAVGNDAGVLALLDLATGVELWRLGPMEGGVRGVRFAPDGSALAVAVRGGEVLRVDPVTGGVVWRVPYPGHALSVDWSDGDVVAVGSSEPVVVYEGGTGRVRHTWTSVPGGVWDARVLPGGVLGFGAFRSTSAGVRLLGLTDGKVATTLVAEDPIYHLAPCGDARVVFVGTQDGHLERWDLTTHTHGGRRKADDGPTMGVDCGAERGLVASIGFSGKVRLWDREAETALRAIPAFEGPGVNVRITPDGRYVLASGAGGALRRFALDHVRAVEEARAGAPIPALGVWGAWDLVPPTSDPVTEARRRLVQGGEGPLPPPLAPADRGYLDTVAAALAR